MKKTTPPKAQKRQTVNNAQALAEQLGVSQRTVRHWKTLPGNPGANASGRYNLQAWRDWAVNNGKRLPSEAGTKQEWERDRIILQVEAMDLELKQRRSQLVPIADVRKWHEEMVYAFNAEFLPVPAVLAPEVVELTIAEAELKIRDAITSALERLSQNPWKKPPTTELPPSVTPSQSGHA